MNINQKDLPQRLAKAKKIRLLEKILEEIEKRKKLLTEINAKLRYRKEFLEAKITELETKIAELEPEVERLEARNLSAKIRSSFNLPTIQN